MDNAFSWNDKTVVGSKLELIDDKSIGVYSFGQDGLAPVTAGAKDGPVMAPLFYWRIEGDKLVLSEEKNGKALGTFQFVSRDGDILTLRVGNGSLQRYRYSR